MSIPALIAEINRARTDPAAYADRVRDLRARYRGNRIERPGRVTVVTQEGVAAVDDTLRFLDAQPPIGPLRASEPLTRAATDHARDQSATGMIGHTGSDGSTAHERMRRHGRFLATGEAIAYGPDHAEEVIMQLIVDDGVPGRGHRAILFNPTYTLVGAACEPHPVWRVVCVVNVGRATPRPIRD